MMCCGISTAYIWSAPFVKHCVEIKLLIDTILTSVCNVLPARRSCKSCTMITPQLVTDEISTLACLPTFISDTTSTIFWPKQDSSSPPLTFKRHDVAGSHLARYTSLHKNVWVSEFSFWLGYLSIRYFIMPWPMGCKSSCLVVGACELLRLRAYAQPVLHRGRIHCLPERGHSALHLHAGVKLRQPLAVLFRVHPCLACVRVCNTELGEHVMTPKWNILL